MGTHPIFESDFDCLTVMVGFNHGGVGGIPAKRKKGNAFLHLAKFTAVQQLALFAPNVEITLERIEKDSPIFRASANYRGELVIAHQQGKKKAKQALCSKVIKKFALLDQYCGRGASEELKIGSHQEELSPDELVSVPVSDRPVVKIDSFEDRPNANYCVNSVQETVK